MKTLYISDLDGTLLDRKGQLSERSEKTIRELIHSGMLFSVATARSQSAAGIISKLDIAVPGVLLNGVLMYDNTVKKYIDCVPMDTISAKKVMSVLRAFDRVSFVYKFDSDCGINVEFERLSNETEQNFFEVRKNTDYKSFRQTDKISVSEEDRVIYFTMVDRYERLFPIYNEISKIGGVKAALYRDNYTEMFFLEVFSSKATKAAGVQKLKKMLNADRVVAFGDNINDIEMLSISDYGIAVGDAVEEVREKADLVIGNSFDDGVANYLLSCKI